MELGENPIVRGGFIRIFVSFCSPTSRQVLDGVSRCIF